MNQAKKSKALSPFDYIQSINAKTPLTDLSGYIPFVINKGLSAYPDTIHYANEMNIHHDIPHHWQYDYLYHSIRKSKRYAEWFKATQKDEIENVMKYFKMSKTKAKEAIRVLDKETINKINKLYTEK